MKSTTLGKLRWHTLLPMNRNPGDRMASWWIRGSGAVPQPTSFDEALAQSMSGNGHGRETAVIALRNLRDDRAIGALLERVNDWVPEVRYQAGVSLQVFLADEFLDGWITALPQVAGLDRARRADHSALKRAIADYLSAPSRRQVLAAAQASLDKVSQRWLFSFLLDRTPHPGEHRELVCQGLMSHDAVIARRSLGAVDAYPDDALKSELFGVAAADGHFSSLRTTALRKALATPAPSTSSLILALCFDGARCVRALALASAGRHTAWVEGSALESLANGEASGQVQAIALDVLCTIRGHTVCADLCEPAIHSVHPRLRQMGFSWSLRTASEENRLPLMLLALQDPIGRVRRLVCEAVRRGACAPDADSLLALAETSPASLREVTRVAEHLSPWARLELLLRLLSSDSTQADGAAQLACAMGQWCDDLQFNFMQPYPAQRERLLGLWRTARASIATPLRERMATDLTHFGVLPSLVLAEVVMPAGRPLSVPP